MARKTFATIGWTVQDVLENAEEIELDVDKRAALEVLKNHESDMKLSQNVRPHPLLMVIKSIAETDPSGQ